MANMTRDQLRDELKVRGWSRFTDAQLEKYLDWSLQDIYGMAKFPRSTLTTFTLVASVLDVIPFATISGASAELVQEIRSVYVKQDGVVTRLRPVEEDYFLSVMRPNTMASSPTTGLPAVYFVFDLAVVLYPKPSEAVDIVVDHLLREDNFTSASDTSGLPERFDKAIIAQTEVHCNRRAHDYEAMLVAENEARRFVFEELGQSGSDMREEQERVLPWRG